MCVVCACGLGCVCVCVLLIGHIMYDVHEGRLQNTILGSEVILGVAAF